MSCLHLLVTNLERDSGCSKYGVRLQSPRRFRAGDCIMSLLKSIIILLVYAGATTAATISNSASAFKSSVVDQGDGTYLYSYSVSPWKLATKRDLSNFIVFWCCDVVAYNYGGSIDFDLEVEDDRVVFDDLEDDNNTTTITFFFESVNIPMDGIVSYKAGRDTWRSATKVPSCAIIPEPASVSLLVVAGILFLTRRRVR